MNDKEVFGGGRAKKPPKRVLRGHEAFLEDLKNSGALVHFRLTSGEKIVATVKTHDQYTVSVIVQDGNDITNGVPCVLFKHAIQFFVVLSSIQRGTKAA